MAGTRGGTCETTSGRKYNESLVPRGAATFRFTEDVTAPSRHPNARPKRGHPFVCGDMAVQGSHVLRELLQLPHRQTEWLGRSLVAPLAISLGIPDHTSLAKRAAKREVSLDVRGPTGPIDVAADGTGLRGFGDHLENRWIPTQRTEARLRGRILNKFSHLGLPRFQWGQSTRPHVTGIGGFGPRSGPDGSLAPVGVGGDHQVVT